MRSAGPGGILPRARVRLREAPSEASRRAWLRPGTMLRLVLLSTTAATTAGAATAAAPPPPQTLVHGWDCISCKTNSMLVSNVGTWRRDFTLDDPWWINTLADSHAAVFLNTFWDKSYNGTGDDSKVKVARALKKRNPKVKTFLYQPADRLGDTV